jgi:hypothetical protein
LWGVSCCYKNILWFFTNFKYLQVILTCYKSPTNFYHIMLYQVHLAWVAFKLTTFVVIGTDCTGSYKSNKHKIMTTTAPQHNTTLQITYDFEPATTLLELSPLNFFFLFKPTNYFSYDIITYYNSVQFKFDFDLNDSYCSRVMFLEHVKNSKILNKNYLEDLVCYSCVVLFLLIKIQMNFIFLRWCRIPLHWIEFKDDVCWF